MAKDIKEAEDNSIGAVIYQGKPLSQWEKEFEGEFTASQLFQLIRSGIDIGRIKLGLVDEADNTIDDKALFKGEEFFFNEDERGSIKDFIMPNCEFRVFSDPSCKEEVWRTRVDVNELKPLVGYIGEFARQLVPVDIQKKYSGNILMGVVYVDGEPLPLDKNALSTIISNIQKRAMRVAANTFKFKDVVESEDVEENDMLQNRAHNAHISTTVSEADDKEEATDNTVEESSRQPEDVVTVADFIGLLRRTTKPEDKIMFRTNKKTALLFDVNSKGGTTVVDIVPAMNEDDMKSTNERRSWYGGGYGGTGRSFRSLSQTGDVPRGADIGWFPVEQVDPKAKGKMPGWRCGPSNFPVKNDLFFPNREYKKGVMVMKNKYVKAGPFSGIVQIAIPSYFEVIRTKNPEGIKVLEDLHIPLDLTFGMDPNDDYSMTYTEKHG